LLGDKARAKKAMKKAGVPMLPGSDGPVSGEEHALKVVKESGYPIIVKEQIRIAAGERLSFKQSEVTFTGHAIECRVNAEDPETFAPSPGVIHAFSAPGGPGVRIDTFAHSECTVTPYYDSMIAKIITWGRDRQEAIARMKRTLDMTVIEGIRTSVPLHLKILNEKDFHAGRLSTSFMDRFMPQPKKTSLADTA